MSEEHRDERQVAAFRTLARRLGNAQSEHKFADALKRLMSPAPEPEDDSAGSTPARPDSPTP